MNKHKTIENKIIIIYVINFSLTKDALCVDSETLPSMFWASSAREGVDQDLPYQVGRVGEEARGN